jgi:hypothetical protein
VLQEYREHLPLTVRQIFYRLVGAYYYPKDEHAYDRLSDLLVKARRARFVAFGHIRDDGVTWQRPDYWADANELVTSFRQAARGFMLDRQRGQEIRLFIGVEAAGMVPQIARVALPYGVPVFSSSGFDSLTFKKDLGDELAACDELVDVLHIGDYDQSGESVFDVLCEDVPALGEDDTIRFSRLAVTPVQIAELGLPTAPPKPTDRRGKNITATTQAEAIPPNVLADIVRRAILERLDGEVYQGILEEEHNIRRELAHRLRRIEGKP